MSSNQHFFKFTVSLVLTIVGMPALGAGAEHWPQALANANLSTQTGKGKINGTELPFTRIDMQDVGDGDALFELIRERSRGTYTVKQSFTSMSRVILMLKVFSEDCVTCPKLSQVNAKEIIETSYAISVYALGEHTFAMGAPTGLLVDKEGVPDYEGDVLDETNKFLKLYANSEYLFGTSYSGQLEGRIDLPLAQAKATVEEDLKRSGYAPFDPSQAPIEGQLVLRPQSSSHEGLWQKGPSVIYVKFKQQSPQTTEFGFYENITN